MKTLKIIICILFLQTFNDCFSQDLFTGTTSSSLTSPKTDAIIGTSVFSLPILTVSVINGINTCRHKPASNNAPFGIILGVFQIAVSSQLSSNYPTLKTINIISGASLIATSTLRLYSFQKDSKTAFDFNILPTPNGTFLVGLRLSHTFN